MKKIKIAIIGSGGHAKSCIEVIEGIKNIKIVGLIDNDPSKKIGKYKVICNEKNIIKLKKITKNLILGIGSLRDNLKRTMIFNKFKRLGFYFPSLISKNSFISKNSKIGEGTIIFHHVFINSGSEIGKNCIVNNKSLIEHDVKIHDHCHISTGVIINGNCEVFKGSFIGSGSVILNNLKIEKNSFIKMGTIKKI
tara:strand:- start:3851 stop:4432 length:582 start_codon:yes stop_codon:yes gene_type:complete